MDKEQVNIKCGTSVKTKIGDVIGMVAAISTRFTRTAYEVSYFLNGEYKSVYLDSEEFDIIELPDKSKAGFL